MRGMLRCGMPRVRRHWPLVSPLSRHTARPVIDRSVDRGALFVAFVAQHGLPAPVRELRFDPVRRWRIDWAWPEHLVALEVEGGIFTRGRHSRGAGMLKDMEKYNELAARGWRLVRTTPDGLCSPETLRVLTLALAAT